MTRKFFIVGCLTYKGTGNMENDLEKYYKSKKVSDDLIKLLSDENYDAQALKEYMESNECACELKENFCDENTLAANLAKFESFDAHQASEKMLKSIRRKKNPKLAWVASISVAAAMIVSFFIFYNQMDEKMETQSEAEETSVPILILASGEKVNLSEIGSGIIAEGCVISTENNTITTNVKTDNKNSNNTLVIPHGYSYSVNLSDGSTVMLNAGGRLSYPVTFDNSLRMVVLEDGEAFFNVSKSDKPFIVKTRNGEVKVYGTKFNVRNFKNGDIETVLVEGSVGVKCGNSEEVKIKPNQRIVFSGDKYVVEDVEVDSHIAWTNNSFMYNGALLLKVIEDIENWYGVQINVGDFSCAVDLYIDRNVGIGKVLKLLEVVTNKNFINDGEGKYSIK